MNPFIQCLESRMLLSGASGGSVAEHPVASQLAIRAAVSHRIYPIDLSGDWVGSFKTRGGIRGALEWRLFGITSAGPDLPGGTSAIIKIAGESFSTVGKGALLPGGGFKYTLGAKHFSAEIVGVMTGKSQYLVGTWSYRLHGAPAVSSSFTLVRQPG